MNKNLTVVVFCSRNKDNKHVEGFIQRRVSFVTTKFIGELVKDFEEFSSKGLDGEMSRMYVSVNSRDSNKVRKAVIHYLIDHEDFDMSKLPSKVASIASGKENAVTNKWLFDFDEDSEYLEDFINDVQASVPEDVIASINDVRTIVSESVHVSHHSTPNGHAVVVDRGFDTRDLLSKWENVELKRDAMLCVRWMYNREE